MTIAVWWHIDQLVNDVIAQLKVQGHHPMTGCLQSFR
jgi:hypothetical protein